MKGLNFLDASSNDSSTNYHQIILDLDLNKISNKLSKQKGWSKCSAERACVLYKRFLILQKKYGEYHILSPSEDMDEVWHLHILDTNKYHKDCELIFGKYFHHVPTYDSRKSMTNSFQATQQLYYQEFNDYIYEARVKIFSRIVELFLTPLKFILKRKKLKSFSFSINGGNVNV